MSQRKIVNLLKRNREKWWYSHEIVFFCRDVHKNNVLLYLKRLRNHNEIKFKATPKKSVINGKYMYRYKE